MQARRGLYVNHLPSNRALPNDVTQESLERGWTTQQPYAHVSSAVAFRCVLCAEVLDTRHWLGHRCTVAGMLERVRVGTT